MQRVHFIAIGGAAMHNLAIAISKKNAFLVTGSDDEIHEPSRSRLQANKLLPDELGWHPDRIHKGLNAVILGAHAKADNPELLRAKELGLKIYSFPEYLFLQTRSKTRIVVGGSHGKTTICSMILFVLKQLKIEADFMIGAQSDGLDDMIKLSYESRIAVFEGDEYHTSSINKQPKFHHYKPHIAVLTGVSWDHINIFPTFENYTQQFQTFADLMEVQGRLVYFDGDETVNLIAEKLRRDIVAFPYNTPEHKVINGITYLITKYGDIPLKIFGDYNLQNLNAARLACRQIGVTDEQFFHAISEFEGARNRLEKIAEKENTVIFKDFAHSPAKVKATVKAIKEQYPDKKLIACLELNTVSSLSDDFLPEYHDTLTVTDKAVVFFKPEDVEKKHLNPLTSDKIRAAFHHDKIEVITDTEKLKQFFETQNYDNTALLLMTSGSFSGFPVRNFMKELIEG